MVFSCFWAREKCETTCFPDVCSRKSLKTLTFSSKSIRNERFWWKSLSIFNKFVKMLKNTYVFHQNRSKSSTFDENPCRFLRKTQKSCETIIITIKNNVFECFCFILLWFFVQDHGTWSKIPIREPVDQVLAGRLIRDPLQTSCLGK